MADFFEKEQALLHEYETMKPLLISWGTFLDNFIPELLRDKGFALHRIQILPKHRVKDDLSLVRKVFYRRRPDPDNPMKGVDDKVGTRIVATTLEDVEKITELLREHTDYWIATESRGMNSHLEKPREFDYRSIHLKLAPTQAVNGFDQLGNADRERYICELQIRTLLQHAFAEVSHDTIYKGPFGMDSHLVRMLSRSMALMETTDETFSSAAKLMQNEETYERNFVENLRTISRNRFGFEFPEKEFDGELTSEIFSTFQVKSIDIQQLEQDLLRHERDVALAMKSMHSYIKSQPVILLLFFLALAQGYNLREKWALDGAILEEIFFRLGIAPRRSG
jgi:ppGpp synthetase/RelA/SpoT-type nucleotidyltranferase